MEQLTALKQGRLSSGRILTFEAAWQDFPIFSHIRSSGTGGSRGQRASTRKSGQSQRRSGISGESDWEERFNLRSSFSAEKVVADLEESEDEKDASDDWEEQDEVEEVQMEDEEFDWRSENSPLGACEAKLSEMVAMMQKAGDRIQFGD